MKFRKETSFWGSLFILSLLAFYKLARRERTGRKEGFFNKILHPFFSAFFAALSLASFFLLVRLCKSNDAHISFRDILSAWLFSSGSVAGWGFIQMYLKKQPYRYSSLWGALFAALTLLMLWKFFGSGSKKT